MKIFVAIPVYDGKLPCETARCLLNEQALALGSGDDFLVHMLPNCSHAAMGRNQLAKDFMESESDRLVFLDSDVTFELGSILRIAKHPVDFVGGAYRYKFGEENYPVGWAPEMRGIPLDDKSALIEVLALPGGFLSISRKVFEVISEKNPDRIYEHFGHNYQCYFEMGFKNNRLYGEDSFFCYSWQECGGKVYLDPELKLTHWDFNKPYPGHVGSWLKKLNGIAEYKIA